MKVIPETYLMKVIPEACHAHLGDHIGRFDLIEVTTWAGLT
jgi:hypothetical protein